MSVFPITTREDFNAAVKFIQDTTESIGVEAMIQSPTLSVIVRSVQRYAEGHNICLFIGGVLAENRPNMSGPDVISPERTDARKVYIAGPMSGLPDFNRKAFNDMADLLRSRGHIVLNPAILPDGLEQHEYMDITIAMLRSSDTLCLLDGWTGSDGAKAEVALARKLKIETKSGYLWRMWA